MCVVGKEELQLGPNAGAHGGGGRRAVPVSTKGRHRAPSALPGLLMAGIVPSIVPQAPKWAIMLPIAILLLLVPQFCEGHTSIILRHMHPSHGKSTNYRNLKTKGLPVGWQVNVVP